MIGAIIGDIIGSSYEFNGTKKMDFPLFPDDSHPTDDSILTIATADVLLNNGIDYEAKYKQYVDTFPWAGYGHRFCLWAMNRGFLAGDSLGNGSAMRVSPVGWAFNELELTQAHATMSAKCSHCHPEGIKGASFVSSAIWFMRHLSTEKPKIRKFLRDNIGFIEDKTVDEIRKDYGFNETCADTLPAAFQCFFEANSYEEAIRLAISLGGDADTLACITGSLAEVIYPIPNIISKKANEIFMKACPELNSIIVSFENKYPRISRGFGINEDWTSDHPHCRENFQSGMRW